MEICKEIALCPQFMVLFVGIVHNFFIVCGCKEEKDREINRYDKWRDEKIKRQIGRKIRWKWDRREVGYMIIVMLKIKREEVQIPLPWCQCQPAFVLYLLLLRRKLPPRLDLSLHSAIVFFMSIMT